MSTLASVPPLDLKYVAMTDFRIGIDLGGSKIEGAAIDTQGKLRVRRRVSTPAGDYHGTIAAIVATVGSIDREIGGPGLCRCRDAGRDFARHRSRQERKFDLPQRPPVSIAISQRRWAGRYTSRTTPIALRCPRQADGAAAACRTVFGVILGTGVGGGIAIDGQILGAPMRLAANGATTRCHGRPRKNGRGPTVIAAGRAASRHFYRARRWRPIIAATSKRIEPCRDRERGRARRGALPCDYDALYRPAGARARDGDQSD